jgi:predicted aminopeptidase
VYVKSDTQFNESFATAVAEIGVERWFAARKEAALLKVYLERKALRRELLQLVEDAKIRLAVLYDSEVDESSMRRQKDAILDQLLRDVNDVLSKNSTNTPGWLGGALNNARLVSLGLYEGWLPAFRELYKDCNGKLDCFYDAAGELAALPQNERHGHLILLGAAAER